MFQTKEQDKDTQKQINEDDSKGDPGSWKMNGETDWELQEMFNKELRDLRNQQTKMNNTIPDMANALEGINSRITEAEEWISKVDDRVVEITAIEKNKEWKKWGESKSTLGQNQTYQHSHHRGSRRRRERERARGNMRRDYKQRFPKCEKGKTHSSARNTENSIQNKPQKKIQQDTY